MVSDAVRLLVENIIESERAGNSFMATSDTVRCWALDVMRAFSSEGGGDSDDTGYQRCSGMVTSTCKGPLVLFLPPLFSLCTAAKCAEHEYLGRAPTEGVK